jgi:hypothetical protein
MGQPGFSSRLCTMLPEKLEWCMEHNLVVSIIGATVAKAGKRCTIVGNIVSDYLIQEVQIQARRAPSNV